MPQEDKPKLVQRIIGLSEQKSGPFYWYKQKNDISYGNYLTAIEINRHYPGFNLIFKDGTRTDLALAPLQDFAIAQGMVWQVVKFHDWKWINKIVMIYENDDNQLLGLELYNDVKGPIMYAGYVWDNKRMERQILLLKPGERVIGARARLKDPNKKSAECGDFQFVVGRIE